MRLKHVAFVILAFVVTLVAAGISIALFESQTGGISRHFETKNRMLFDTYAAFLVPKLSEDRVLDVTGPIKRTGAQSYQFRSTPFSTRFTSHIAVDGEKGEFLLRISAVNKGRRWEELSFDIAPPEIPFQQEDWETSITLESIESLGDPDIDEIVVPSRPQVPDIPEVPETEPEE